MIMSRLYNKNKKNELKYTQKNCPNKPINMKKKQPLLLAKIREMQIKLY